MNIKDGYFLAERVGNVDLAEWRGISAAIRFFTCGNCFDDLALPQADHADFVFAPIARVNLPEPRNVYGSSDPGEAMDRRDQLVRAHIDDIQDAWSEMRGKQVMIFVIHREVVEMLASRARQVDDGYLLECRRRSGKAQQHQRRDDKATPDDVHRNERRVCQQLNSPTAKTWRAPGNDLRTFLVISRAASLTQTEARLE